MRNNTALRSSLAETIVNVTFRLPFYRVCSFSSLLLILTKFVMIMSLIEARASNYAKSIYNYLEDI